MAVWAVFYLLVYAGFNWTAVFFPVVILPLVLATMGFAWILTSLGVFVRGITQVIGIPTTVLLFLSPIFYPVSALPEQYQTLLHFNPLTFMIEETRSVDKVFTLLRRMALDRTLLRRHSLLCQNQFTWEKSAVEFLAHNGWELQARRPTGRHRTGTVPMHESRPKGGAILRRPVLRG